jgi:hypothetical protein
MKKVLAIVLMTVAFGAQAYVAPAQPAASAVQNDKCVKKDKNGKCPALPDSPKPTPKKKLESAK